MNTIIETPSKHAIDYNITDAALMELCERYKTVPNLETKDGYKEASSALSVLRKYRTDVEKKRKELKADALEYGRMVDAEAKRITASLEAIENPIKQAKDDYDTRKQREEEARINAIRKRIGRFSATVHEVGVGTLATMNEALEVLQRQEIDESYGEFREEAERTKRDSVEAITKLIAREEERIKLEEANRIERERLAQERAEMEAQQKEEERIREIRKRIAHLIVAANHASTGTLPTMRQSLAMLQGQKIDETFEEFREEAERRINESMEELKALIVREEERERQEEALRAEREAIEKERRELEALRREEEKRAAKEREEIKQPAKPAEFIAEPLRLNIKEPEPVASETRWVLTLKVGGGEFVLDTHLGQVTTNDKEELMQLIAGTLHEVTL